MKFELKTLEVIDKLKALHQHYIRLANTSKEKGASLSAAKYAIQAEAVKSAIHEIELMSELIEAE